MVKKTLDSSLLDNAIKFACDCHSGMERRGKGFPYITHPMEAVAICATMTKDQELLAAAALHDVMEDCDIPRIEIENRFGKRVADIVESESDKLDPNVEEAVTWKDRKKAAINRIKNASIDSKIVAMSDKLSNMRAIWRDYQEIGDSIWDLFHIKDKIEHEWHYRSLADSLQSLSNTWAYKEFVKLIDDVFGK